MKTFKAAANISYHIPLVGAAVIPYHDNRSPKMLQEVAQELAYFGLLDILLVKSKIEAESASFGADRYARDDADSVAKLMMANYWG